jgi:cobalamin-dependent methionine synthase I
VLVIGERTNTNGSKAFREATIAEDYQKCLDIAKDQTRDGAHLLEGRFGAETKVAIAEWIIEDFTTNWGVDESSILVDCLTFTIAMGQEESRRDGIETIEVIRLLKQRHPNVLPINTILDVAQDKSADVVGMSGLLVKSTDAFELHHPEAKYFNV